MSSPILQALSQVQQWTSLFFGAFSCISLATLGAVLTWHFASPLCLRALLLLSSDRALKDAESSALSRVQLLIGTLSERSATSFGKVTSFLRCTLGGWLNRRCYWNSRMSATLVEHSTKSSKRLQSSRTHESFQRYQRHEGIDSKPSLSSSRALSTTLPWTIKISLAVLWGVCWMFYPAEDEPAYVANNPTDQKYSVDWNEIQQSYQEISQIDLATAPTAYLAQPEIVETSQTRFQEQVPSEMTTSSRGAAWSRDGNFPTMRESEHVLALRQTPPALDQGYDEIPAFRPRLSSASPSQANTGLEHGYRTYGRHEPPPSNRSSMSSGLSWSLASGNRPAQQVALAGLPVTTSVEATAYISHAGQAAIGNESGSLYTNRQGVTYSFQPDPLQGLGVPASSDTGLTPFLSHDFSHLDMVEDLSYPISPPGDDRLSRSTSSVDMRMKMEASSANRAYPQTMKRDRTPPRNANNEIYCDHPDCAGKREIFSRACEWNKHMDKHDRPYKCLERGCERLLGFTYSGGLLRHNREVHKKNLSTRNPLYCPFPNCNRNAASGHGFTRLENLNEHKRRRHPGEEPPATPKTTSSVSPADSGTKRKRRPAASGDEQDSESEVESDEEVSPETKKRSGAESAERSQHVVERLRSDLRKRDEQIAQQQAYIDSLRTTIRTLQPPTPQQQQQKGMARGNVTGKRG